MTKEVAFDVTFKSHVDLGDMVHVDGDTSIRCRVTAVCFRTLCYEIEVSWWHHGDLKTAWVDMTRVTPA